MKPYSFEEHLTKKYEKTVWWWPCKWYIEPYALSFDGWEHNAQYYKSNYPVQYFLRRELPCLWNIRVVMPLRELKYEIKGRLRNPRKEMRDSVFSHRWQDLTYTIVNFHIQAVIEFVDREKCFDHVVYSDTEIHKKFERELREMYNYAKTGKGELEKSLDKAYERVDHSKHYEEAYKEVHTIEQAIEDHDTKLCQWVAENRQFFWV